MPEHTTTVWTCTRCGCVEEVEGTGQPKNWVRVGFVTPPKASWSDCLTVMGDLCNGPRCGGLLVEFVNGKEKTAEERLDDYDEMMSSIEGAHSGRSEVCDPECRDEASVCTCEAVPWASCPAHSGRVDS